MNDKALKAAKEWLEDIPQQFHEKPNIETLVTAYGRQFAEVLQVFEDLKARASISTAVGQNLDGIGDILSLPREKAYTIVQGLRDANIDDDLYRKLLHFQALKKSAQGTYYDLVDATRLLWDADGILYREPEGSPATVEMIVPDISVDEQDPLLNRAITIKPAGVKVYYLTNYLVYQYHETEKANLQNVNVHAEMFFDDYVRLDGSWKLDGRQLLNATPKGIEVTITEQS